MHYNFHVEIVLLYQNPWFHKYHISKSIDQHWNLLRQKQNFQNKTDRQVRSNTPSIVQNDQSILYQIASESEYIKTDLPLWKSHCHLAETEGRVKKEYIRTIILQNETKNNKKIIRKEW